MTIDEYLQVYDLLREEMQQETARRFVASHADTEPSYMATVERDGRIVGVAFCWQINDPHDVEVVHGYPGEQSGAKYIYWPHAFISKDYRDNGVWIELLVRSIEICPGAERLAYHQDGELEIHSIKDLLNEQAGASDGDQRRTGDSTAATEHPRHPPERASYPGDGTEGGLAPVGQGRQELGQEEGREALAGAHSGGAGYKAF